MRSLRDRRRRSGRADPERARAARSSPGSRASSARPYRAITPVLIALRPRVGARELRLPRLAAGLRREERRQRRAGDDDPRQGGAVRDSGLGRRRLALRPLEQPRDADSRRRGRGRERSLVFAGSPRRSSTTRRSSPRCSSCCSSSMWATVSALAPYAAEIYPTAIRGAGSGVVAGATKLGGVIALGIAVMSWAPPSVAGAALLAAVPAAARRAAARLRRRSRRAAAARGDLERRDPRRSAASPGASARCASRGVEYPVIFPSWKDPRLHLSAHVRLLCTCSARSSSTSGSRSRRSSTPILTCAADRGRRHVPAEARDPLAGERDPDRQRDRVHHAHPGHAARRLVDAPTASGSTRPSAPSRWRRST